MPNPFPGMNPFLEAPAFWEEFHAVLITECLYQLSDRLPDSYIARIHERVFSISISDDAARQYIPDVMVARRKSAQTEHSFTDAGGTAVLARPVTIRSTDDLEIREGYIEILRMPDRELVSSIELLSPANKVGEGAGVYSDKRRALVARGIHVVEIDLLLRGPRTKLAEPLPPGDYFGMVFRGDRRPDVDVYSWSLQDPLPPIPIPLKGINESVNLALAEAFASAFDRGRYDRKLSYALPWPIALTLAQTQWINDRLQPIRRP
jgi:hypothetical protein